MATTSKFFTEYGQKDLGNTEIDGNLTVSGNFTVSGTQTIIDSTTTSVTDSMLELASGNTTADLLDIGFYGNYNDGLSGESGVSEYTGLLIFSSKMGRLSPSLFMILVKKTSCTGFP